jgi:site-specific DNA-methyltransferase (adenine-specific)
MWSGMRRAGDRDSEGVKRVHPTQKPVGMLSMILQDFSEKNDIVLDCFGGSGSTLIACEQLERRCYMIELDPHYCDVIVARWEKFTGKQAVKMG